MQARFQSELDERSCGVKVFTGCWTPLTGKGVSPICQGPPDRFSRAISSNSFRAESCHHIKRCCSCIPRIRFFWDGAQLWGSCFGKAFSPRAVGSSSDAGQGGSSRVLGTLIQRLQTGPLSAGLPGAALHFSPEPPGHCSAAAKWGSRQIREIQRSDGICFGLCQEGSWHQEQNQRYARVRATWCLKNQILVF